MGADEYIEPKALDRIVGVAKTAGLAVRATVDSKPDDKDPDTASVNMCF